MTMSLEAAAQAMREAMRETVKRYSLWYLIQGALMVLGGVVALIYPIVSSVAVVLLLDVQSRRPRCWGRSLAYRPAW